jgi:hypothetical protein
MDLFGLIEVQHPPMPVVPWCPVRLTPTDFGTALFTLLDDREDYLEDIEEEETENDEPQDESPSDTEGGLHPLLAPWFPTWPILAAHAERIGAHRQVGRLLQLDHRQALGDSTRRSTIEVREETQVPPTGELLEVVFAIRYVAEQRFDRLPIAHHVQAGDGHSA